MSSASPRPTSPALTTRVAPSTTPARVPTVPADVPTTGENLLKRTELPPKMPVAATAHTPAGAQAFAVFFVKTIDWGFATESSAYMRHYYLAPCGICTVYADYFDQKRAAGRYHVGGRFTFLITMPAIPSTRIDSEFCVKVSVSGTAVEVVDSKGGFVSGAGPTPLGVFQTYTRWTDGAWIVTYLYFNTSL